MPKAQSVMYETWRECFMHHIWYPYILKAIPILIKCCQGDAQNYCWQMTDNFNSWNDV